MGRLTIIIDTENDAFQGQTVGELTTVLRQAASKMERGWKTCTLLDTNGNTCGCMTYDADHGQG